MNQDSSGGIVTEASLSAGVTHFSLLHWLWGPHRLSFAMGTRPFFIGGKTVGPEADFKNIYIYKWIRGAGWRS
jgi:hypothetical protein